VRGVVLSEKLNAPLCDGDKPDVTNTVCMCQAGEFLKQLSHSVAESKLKCYVDADVLEAVLAASGDVVSRPSRAGTGDSASVTTSSDAEEIADDDDCLLAAAVASSRPTPLPHAF